MDKKANSIDRRAFLQGLGVSVAGIAGASILAGTALAEGSGSASGSAASGSASGSAASGSAASGSGSASASAGASASGSGSAWAPDTTISGNDLACPNGAWLGNAPYIDDSACSTMEADVVVVGAGVAGISAARAAVENGASVIVVEQTPAPVIRGLVFGALDSTFQQGLGSHYDHGEVVNEICKAMDNRPNAALWMKWADESGETFDWFTEALDDTDTYFLEFWPNPEGYDNATELRPQYCTGIEFVDWVGAVTKHYQKSVDEGAQYVFNTRGIELFKDDEGAIGGVYGQNADGTYTKFIADKGVIVTTGDYGHNVEMVKDLCPEFYWNCGGTGTQIVTSNGDGHKMICWAGGMMEPSPHAHMDHTFADMFGIGNTTTLSLNIKGERYMNEDCDAQSFTNQMVRQPERRSIQVFDATWQTMIMNQPISHGMPFRQSDAVDAEIAGMQKAIDGAYASPSPFLAGFDTLEELFGFLGIPVDVAVASVDRYNELCDAGVDSDFGKRADRMYPISTPPFYAAGSILATGVMTAGVVVDSDLKVLDENYDPIPHLWAAGNVAGGRYAAQYPVAPVVATSHGTAITFGRSCGIQAAQA